MFTFIFSLLLFLLAFFLGFISGKTYYIAKMIPEDIENTSLYLDSIMKEVNRRNNLSKTAKARIRLNGRFVKE